ncbi:hypothetical protein Tco_1043575 [Tanacetum coccineum]|uniref:Uncharacterized protein n=1 Tax=Tanacetum coccineum TaxID=301880 RepID=A0ABQ5GMF5_9ASTR
MLGSFEPVTYDPLLWSSFFSLAISQEDTDVFRTPFLKDPPARIKVHELSKSKVDLSAQLRDLKLKLALLRVAKITGAQKGERVVLSEAVAALRNYIPSQKFSSKDDSGATGFLGQWKDLRVNEEVVSKESRDPVDARCRKLLASWVRDMAV